MQDASSRSVRLFRNGANQAVRIPREFELPGDEATIRKEGDRLIIEPVRRNRLRELLASWEPTDVDVMDGVTDLPPAADDVDL